MLLSLIGFAACNPTKDKWLNRNFHTLTGHFNVYFNGEQKLLDAINQIEATHVDNFDKVLEVFPMGTEESAKTAGNVLDEAIKKFSKTIQMHTIGSFTDDSYFAMAKCRFYKQDYFASIETFQYIIGKYKDGEFKDLSTCWIARNYMGMKKMGEAEALMGLLLANKQIKKEDYAVIYATAADISIKQEKLGPAIDQLKMALKGKLTKNQKIRYHYILGQLCLLTDRKPEATYFFNKVISYIPSYDFAFNANINLTRIYDLNDPRSIAKVKKNLRKMTTDDKNKDYLDQLYFELGKLDLIQKNTNEATKDFKKSVASSTKNKNQKGLSYYELAKLFFEQKDFKISQAYYDSTVLNLDKTHKQFEQINDTKIVLSDLINNLKVYEAEDSLQKLSVLSKDEIERKIDSWIAEVKRQEEIAAKEAKKNAKHAASIANNANLNPSIPAGIPGAGDNSWYFYNPTLMAAGRAEFFSNKKWGQRKNEDFWMIAAKEKTSVEADESPQDSSTLGSNQKKEIIDGKEIAAEPKVSNLTGDAERDNWIKNVPFSSSQKQRSNDRMIESLNNLGLIYYTRLKNPSESRKYFDILQKRFPISEYEPAAFYYLYKSNDELNNKKIAEENKQNLITNYPEHPYSLLVQNKTIQSSESSNNKELIAAYEKAYAAYLSGNYAEALQLKENIGKEFPGNVFNPKLDLLNAFIIGKTKDKEAFKKALTEVSTKHKGLDVAQTADDYLEVLNRAEKKSAFAAKNNGNAEPGFDLETETPYYYVLAIKNQKVDFNEFVSVYTNFNETYASEKSLRVNLMMSNEGYQLLVVREFANRKDAEEYFKTLQATDLKAKKLSYNEPSPEYIISTKNFRIVLKDKKVEKFAEFYKKQEESLKQ
ncbi:MAG: hypothetical protein K9H61_05400 [Bacteroidia bacterium]|nr:hypothetical protein [Bacteroidia bacterium]MCF8427218.1 hypothetical protein [Bacteroidia bacterium]MCF8446416.1 hypothetical protein [Bacteroidia bacterium]